MEKPQRRTAAAVRGVRAALNLLTWRPGERLAYSGPWTRRQRQSLTSGGALLGFAAGLIAAQFTAPQVVLIGCGLLGLAFRDYLLGFSRGWSRDD